MRNERSEECLYFQAEAVRVELSITSSARTRRLSAAVADMFRKVDRR